MVFTPSCTDEFWIGLNNAGLFMPSGSEIALLWCTLMIDGKEANNILILPNNCKNISRNNF